MKIITLVTLIGLLALNCTKIKTSKKYRGMGPLTPQSDRNQVIVRTEDDPNADPWGDPIESKRGASLSLVWKKYRALQNQLMQTLELSNIELCQELDRFDCVNEVYLFALGGNEPFEKTQYQGMLAPSAISTVAVERLVISACNKRLALDKAAGSGARVFKAFALGEQKPSAEELNTHINNLFKRFLLRTPTDSEQSIIADSVKDYGGELTAKITCYALASHVENIFI